MDKNRIIQMIDEYLTEPHSISNEWVQALLVCKQALLDNDIQKAEIESLKHRKTELQIRNQELQHEKSEARKEFAERGYRFLCNWRNWNALKTKWLFNGECEWLKEKIDNLLKEM